VSASPSVRETVAYKVQDDIVSSSPATAAGVYARTRRDTSVARWWTTPAETESDDREPSGGLKATVLPVARGISHIILQVEDDGSPTLTSYRRIILRAR
jgi:hypothetical protein